MDASSACGFAVCIVRKCRCYVGQLKAGRGRHSASTTVLCDAL